MATSLSVAALLAAALLEAPPALAQNADAPYAASRLVSRWRSVMTLALDESRASASEDVADLMEVFVSPGAVRMVRDKASEEDIKKADEVLRRFVDAMVKASERRPDGSVIVEPASIEPAEKAICPVYPFC